MDRTRLHDRITEQFSDRGARADVWKGFDLVLDTDSFLNLGYSKWYQPHVLGSSQRRLAAKIGSVLEDQFPRCSGSRLLDVGCGRGGPAIHLAEQFGFEVTGVDLVPYNVRTATENARSSDADATFVLGDASALPVAPGTVDACTSIDALVYVPNRGAVVSEMADALAGGGVLVVSDLVRSADAGDAGSGGSAAVSAFADAWDMAPIGTASEHCQMLADAGLSVASVEDVTANSVGRFGKWTTLFLGLAGSPAAPLLERALAALELDPAAVVEQVRRAHEALPSLRHVIVVARKQTSSGA